MWGEGSEILEIFIIATTQTEKRECDKIISYMHADRRQVCWEVGARPPKKNRVKGTHRRSQAKNLVITDMYRSRSSHIGVWLECSNLTWVTWGILSNNGWITKSCAMS